jgi:hypothetical protein
MSQDNKKSLNSKDNPPDHRLSSARIPLSNEEPTVKALVNLKAYVKPNLDEELSDPSGAQALPGTEMICRCVPVEQCMCNSVDYYVDSKPCPTHCSCVGYTCHACKHWICTCVRV